MRKEVRWDKRDRREKGRGWDRWGDVGDGCVNGDTPPT